jgi:hypothetical protein
VEEEGPWKTKSRKKRKWKEEYDEGERSRKKNNTWKEKRRKNTKSREKKNDKGGRGVRRITCCRGRRRRREK